MVHLLEKEMKVELTTSTGAFSKNTHMCCDHMCREKHARASSQITHLEDHWPDKLINGRTLSQRRLKARVVRKESNATTELHTMH